MNPAPSSTPRIVTLLCVAEILRMTGFATYPALLPTLQQARGLSNSQAGLISGIFFGGYMMATPVLVSLTDRMDARRAVHSILGFGIGCALAPLIVAVDARYRARQRVNA